MNPTFLLFLALIISREEPVNSKAPLSNEAPKCNAALQYYLAFLNSPSFERLPTEEQ